MPSFWKRIGLAAALTAQVGASPMLTFAQHYPSLGNRCTTTQPCPPSGRAHVASPDSTTPAPEPPPWQAPGTTPPVPTDTTPMPPDASPMPPDPGMADQTPDFAPPSDQALSFNQQQLGIGSPDQAFAPNMMGDLLRAYRGIEFSYLQAADRGVANTSGTVNFRNSKVADNNSAVPRDRIGLRYNYFHNGLTIRGLESSPVTRQRDTDVIDSQGNIVRTITTFQNEVQPTSRDVDVHLYTLQLEKTFFDNMASIEVRIPFANTISSDLDLSAGNKFLEDPNALTFSVDPTPGNTLGDTATEIQDMNIILKSILAQDPNRRWVVSGGLGITVPTGEDLNVRVVDYSNDVVQGAQESIVFFNGQGFVENVFGDFGDFNDVTRGIDLPVNSFRRLQYNNFPFDQRTRTFTIENETWGVAPFLAAVATPTDSVFFNAFSQLDVPVNQSDWTYREIDVDQRFNPQYESELVQYDRTLSGKLQDQLLLHLDIGGGFWLYQNPQSDFISGLAALVELHYTTTLEDADIVVVDAVQNRARNVIRFPQGDPNVFSNDPPTSEQLTVENKPRLGNIANRVDILNLTLGTVVQISDKAILATGYVTPLRDDETDRFFDGELNVQLNIYR